MRSHGDTVLYLGWIQPDWLRHADLIFLRRVDGGYIFMHRMLLDHLASLDAMTTPGAASTSDGRPNG